MASSALILTFCLFCIVGHARASVPAMYVFGDSLLDVGNNNYIATFIKANQPYNGIDYPGSEATGRFSNGKNVVDFLAEKVGVVSPEPYLSLSSSADNTEEFVKGISFASGGAGILPSATGCFLGICNPLDTQIEQFSQVYNTLVEHLGAEQARIHLSKSIFLINNGNNDLLDYFLLRVPALLINKDYYLNRLASTLQGQLKRMYDLGARKFAFLGVATVGCVPLIRAQNKSGDCLIEADQLGAQHRSNVVSLLQKLQENLSGFSYSYFDFSVTWLQYINNPTAYGFTEAKVACCGLGFLNAQNILCNPTTPYCSDRTSYLFWDSVHPTETMAGVLMDIAFSGSSPYVYPINVMQLSAL